MKKLIASLLVLYAASPNIALAESLCDFDGDGMSEFVVVNPDSNGNYDWQTFDPRSGSSSTLIKGFGNSSSKLIPGNWVDANRAIAAVVDPVSGGPTGRATWSVRSDDKYAGTSYSYARSLGRPGDIIILGGDYDGNGITDSLILKRTTGKLGLRVNFFLSSYNADRLGKERLYKALGSPFVDKNFYFSRDGKTDYLGVIRKSRGGNSKILTLKPFTDTPHAISMGVLPSGAQGPIALRQRTGSPDLLVFYVRKNGATSLTIKNQSGRTLVSKKVSGNGAVSVGDYLADGGYEIAVQGKNTVEIYNPISNSDVTVTPPSGQLVSCVGNQTIQ